MKLNDASLNKFKVAKEFAESTLRINSIDFSNDGRTMVSSSDDDTIRVYDCEKGIRTREVGSKKYGADLIRFTHARHAAIHTSNKENDTIRYLSLYDNKYLRYFIGHEKRVVTLSMSPADDTFLSGSIDGTVRIWDLKSEKATGKLQMQGFPVANFDPEGLVFAIGSSDFIKLYDSRLFEKGPFNTIKLPNRPQNLTWRSLKFSPNGKQILITTDHEEIHVLDAFSGQPLHKLNIGPRPQTPLEHPCEATYTPDSQYILCGSQDGSLHVWSASKGSKLGILTPDVPNPGAVQCVMFNPTYMLIASACSRLYFWIPKADEFQNPS